MKSYSKTTWIGNLVNNPVLIEINNEKKTKKVEFTIAVNRSNSKELEAQGKQSVDYFKCEMFGALAEVLADSKKGDALFVEGEMHIDRVDIISTSVETKYYPKLIISNFVLLEKKHLEEEEEF